MSACERCWDDAGGDPERYRELLAERRAIPCTPEQQAGPDAKWCPSCGRRATHQIVLVCMACGTDNRVLTQDGHGLALSPEAAKPALTEAEIEAARKRAAERIEKFGWDPKPAEAATCEPWCGTDAGATGDTVPYYCSANGKAWDNWDCRRAGRCLHPATEQAATCAQRDCGDVATVGIWCAHHGRSPAEQAATCGTCGGKREVSRKVKIRVRGETMEDIAREPCPACGPAEQEGGNR